MRLVFAKPTYGPSPDQSIDRSHRSAIMHAANNGVTWVGDLSPDRYGWAAARNGVVEQVLEVAKADHVDGVFWMDDDLLVPTYAITRLVGHKLDMVSGLYFQRHPPFWPIWARLTNKGAFEWPVEYPENTVIPCDGVGFGCLYTSMDMLRAVAAMPECRPEGPFGGDFGKKTYGEDFAFCLRAGKVGYRPHVDTGVKCEHHMGPEFANEHTFTSFREMLRRNNGQAERADP